MSKRPSDGFVLILVIFIMMVFGILGWTLAVMQAGNLGSSARNLQDKQALYLAVSGAHWGLDKRINTGTTTSSDSDCSDTGDWVNHTLAPGQYKVCTRGPLAPETADVVVESIGYVPTIANYTSVRRVKVTANLGSFDKAVVAMGLFKWTENTNYQDQSRVVGDMMCMYYEGNGNNVHNEEGKYYDYLNTPPWPKTTRINNTARRDVGMGELPELNMKAYELDGNATILAPGNTLATSNTTTISDILQVGGNTQVTVSDTNFFGALPAAQSKMVNQVLRDISLGTWESGTWSYIQQVLGGNSVLLNGIMNWTVDDRVTIERRINVAPVFEEVDVGGHPHHDYRSYYTVTVNGTVSWPMNQAVRNFSRNTWNPTDWGVITEAPVPAPNNNTNVTVEMFDLPHTPPESSEAWKAGDVIGMVRRFTSADCDPGDLLHNDKPRRQDIMPKVLYIESDVLFDVRDDSIGVSNVGVVVEGDIVILGPEDIFFTKYPPIYPNLATKNGNVYSPTHPNTHEGGRNFDDIIFSQNGDIEFNYLDVKAVYGKNITLSGIFKIKYDPDLTKLSGYAFGASGVEWKEQ
jgi:hypothetical protein